MTDHWFEDVASELGESYLKYSFTKGTENEVEFLVSQLGLQPGDRVLDVGCGPGRHAIALAERGIHVVGVDIAQTFIDLANENAPALATFLRMDARQLPFESEFDAVISLCQGAFGLSGGGTETRLDPDAFVLAGMARALKPSGVLALSAFSAYFQIRWLEEFDEFDVEAGVNHERTILRTPQGQEVEKDLWTTCFTPRELRLLAERAGLTPLHIWSVTPGDYAARTPELDRPEFLLIARR
ncbi:MAG: hypothetical protein RLZZ31_522 [Actinomycetota bacterium]